LEHGLEAGDGPTTAKKAREARPTAATESRERLEDCGVSNQIEYGVDTPRMSLADAIMQAGRFKKDLARSE
jgi:hypothetical protein